MLTYMKTWWESYFSDEEALVLAILLISGLLVILSMGSMLGPVFVGMVIAFLMQGIVKGMERYRVPHMVAVSLVFTLFLGLLFALIFIMLPLIWSQLLSLFAELPSMFSRGQALLAGLPEKYPQFMTEAQLQGWMNEAANEMGRLGQWLLSYSLSTLNNLLLIIIYLIMVPILVFFFLKDRGILVHWLSSLLPKDRKLMQQIWQEMNLQIANYIRGKVIEVVVVGAVSYMAFVFMGLNYAALLALLVGLSVIVPYVGAAVVTIPVALISVIQWGWTPEFFYLMLVYGIIQTLDGNLLVPFLFSEVVDLHPVAIITAVLFFGGLWGIWGVFFAIPLATLIKAILNAWPTAQRKSSVAEPSID